MRNPFKSKPSLAELQDKDEYLSTKLSIREKEAAIKELEQRMGKGSWKIFSSDGTKGGISWQRVYNWLKGH